MHSSSSSSSSGSHARLATLAALLAARYARAIITPTAPWSTVVDVAGQPCDMQWNLDPTGEWTNMTIQFMTGSNQAFVHITDVATGVDGTTGDGKYSWTCPDVTIPAPIYFYQFINNGNASNPTYTTRFTISEADGTVVAAPNPIQPDGSAIPWGIGGIEGQPTPGGGSSTGTTVTTGGGSNTDSTLSTTGVSSDSSNTSTAAETTVVTVTPSDSSTPTTRRTATTGTSAATTGVTSNPNNSTSNGTGAAGRSISSNTGSVAAVGLGLAMLLGYFMV